MAFKVLEVWALTVWRLVWRAYGPYIGVRIRGPLGTETKRARSRVKKDRVPFEGSPEYYLLDYIPNPNRRLTKMGQTMGFAEVAESENPQE